MALRSVGGSVPSAACCAASAIVAPSASARLDGAGAHGRGTHVDQRDASRRSVGTYRDRADDGPVLGPPVELLIRAPRRGQLRHPNLGEQLVGPQRGLQKALEEVGSGNGPVTRRTSCDERRIECEEHGRQVGRRIAVRDRAPDRAAVAHLVVAHFARDRPDRVALLGQHRAGLEVAVPRQRADRDVIAAVADV